MPHQQSGPHQQDLVDGPARIRLVAFDLDGTLTRGQTCMEAIADAFGFAAQMSVWEQSRTEQELTAARLGIERGFFQVGALLQSFDELEHAAANEDAGGGESADAHARHEH